MSLVKAVVSVGLYPNLARIAYTHTKKQQQQNRRSRLLLSTRNNLSGLLMHPSSVNARVPNLPESYLAFHEATRSACVCVCVCVFLSLVCFCSHRVCAGQQTYSFAAPRWFPLSRCCCSLASSDNAGVSLSFTLALCLFLCSLSVFSL